VFSVDDVRNGFLSAFNAPFDDQLCGVVVVGICRYTMPEKIVNQRIQTPNSILDMDDIPRPTPRVLSEGVEYPQHKRYTLHLFQSLGSHLNNTDAAFSTPTPNNLPAELFLLYQYAACVVKAWGRGTDYLNTLTYDRPSLPRSSLNKGRKAKCEYSGEEGGRHRETETKLDPFDLILALWANTPAAVKRQEREQSELSSKMNDWVQNVQQPVEHDGQELGSDFFSNQDDQPARRPEQESNVSS